MKNFKLVLFALLAVSMLAVKSHARYASTNDATQPDAWCVYGPNATRNSSSQVTAGEVCVDYNGNLVPSTSGGASLGLVATPFANVQANTINTAGASLTIGGPLVHSGPMIAGKTQVGTGGSSILGIYASTTIPVTSTYETMVSSGLNITLTATPTISTATVIGGSTSLTSGTLLVLSSTATATITFQDEGTLTGSKLQLGAATRTIGQFKTLTLIYDAVDGFWREIAYGNN